MKKVFTHSLFVLACMLFITSIASAQVSAPSNQMIEGQKTVSVTPRSEIKLEKNNSTNISTSFTTNALENSVLSEAEIIENVVKSYGLNVEFMSTADYNALTNTQKSKINADDSIIVTDEALAKLNDLIVKLKN